MIRCTQTDTGDLEKEKSKTHRTGRVSSFQFVVFAFRLNDFMLSP